MKKSKSGLCLSWMAGSVLLMVGCGGTIQFHGKEPVAVQGTPPAAPPPAAPAPEPKKRRVAVHANKIEIEEKIQFADNSATILEKSFSLMDEIVSVIKENPKIEHITIEGHASSEGNAAHNTTLSDERAHSVMEYLIKKGVDKNLLAAKGFGSSQPIAPDTTEEGREKNRRVDFTIDSKPAAEAKPAKAEAAKPAKAEAAKPAKAEAAKPAAK